MKTGHEGSAGEGRGLVIDRAARRVMLAGELLDLPDLSFRFLVALAESAPEPVSLDRLQAQVWGEVQVGSDAIKQRARLLREALRAAGLQGDPVPSERHRGYRLACAVEILTDPDPDAEGDIDRPPVERMRLVLVAAAMVFVVALAGLFWPSPAPDRLVVSYSRVAGDVGALPASLAAQFASLDGMEMVEGDSDAARVRLSVTLEGEGEARRVRLQLDDRATGRLIASDLYDLPSGAGLDETDRIAAHFVLRMQDRLVAAYPDIVLASDGLPEEASEAYLTALDAMAVGHEAGLVIAAEALRRAVSVAPDFAAAHARLALVLARLSRLGDGDPGLATDALVHARQAQTLDPLGAETERAMGMALWAVGDLDAARLHLERANARHGLLDRDLAALEREAMQFATTPE